VIVVKITQLLSCCFSICHVYAQYIDVNTGLQELGMKITGFHAAENILHAVKNLY